MMYRRINEGPTLNKIHQSYRTSPKIEKFHKQDHDKHIRKGKAHYEFEGNKWHRYWEMHVEERGINTHKWEFNYMTDWVSWWGWKLYGQEYE